MEENPEILEPQIFIKEEFEKDIDQNVKNEPKMESIFEESREEIIAKNTQNVLELMNSLDPMISWEVLDKIITSKFSLSEMLIMKCRGNGLPINFALLINLFDEMVQNLSDLFVENFDPNGDSGSGLILTERLSYCIFGDKGPKEIFFKTTKNVKPDEIFIEGGITGISDIVACNSHDRELTLNRAPSSQRKRTFAEEPAAAVKVKKINKCRYCKIYYSVFESHDCDKMPERMECSYCTKLIILSGSSHNCLGKQRINPVKCLKCQKIVSKQHFQTAHSKVCPGQKEPDWYKTVGKRPNKCFVCIHPKCADENKSFENDLKPVWKHFYECHMDEPDKNIFECTSQPCELKFPYYKMVRWHIWNHHGGDKNYFCPHCSYACSTPKRLQTHKRTHTGEKPFFCDICSIFFTTSNAFNRHKARKHSENSEKLKKYSCKQCEKRFWDKRAFIEHQLSHTNIKRFTCKLCQKSLKNDSCLRRHMITIHDESFKCQLCKSQFSSLKGLQQHRRDQHGEFV